MKATIDIDIGGTFTDCYVTHGDRRVWCKTRTTAYDLSVAMNETIEEGATRLGISTEELLRGRGDHSLFDHAGDESADRAQGPQAGSTDHRGL